MGSLLWQLREVCLRGDDIFRLEDATLEIHEGVTAVIGASGAGKTSLLNLLVGFEAPDSGSIAASLPRGAHPLPIFWVPQDAGLWPHLTARGHLEAVRPSGVGQQRISAVLSSLDIEGRAGSYPGQLSQGEKARLSVARALVCGAAVLVMDEPFVSVDAARVGRYWRTVRESIAGTKTSLVFSTHRPEAVLSEADRVICLKNGRVLYTGGVEELYRSPATCELAECLGEANWLEPEEAQLWLKVEADAPRCFRPEQISITRTRDGAAKVQSSLFAGAVAQAELKHEKTGRVRRFFHRPSANSLRPGDRVVIKVRREGSPNFKIQQ
jgi:ABC-type Fe3+/spermidine/putrescine transport system ATPase subunit